MYAVITGSTTLQELDVSINAIRDNGASVITDELHSCEKLKRLNISDCELSVTGTVYYTKCIDMLNGWWMIDMIDHEYATIIEI